MINKSLALKIIIPLVLVLLLFTFIKASPLGSKSSNLLVTQGVIELDGDLYYNPKCRLCRRVISYMDKNHIKINMKNVIAEPHYKTELRQYNLAIVPVYIVNSKPIVGDKDIIAYLEKKTDRIKK